MKCEPSVFSISDLEKQGKYFWDGVRNYQVRNYFRDEMKVGDLAVFYHSSCEEVGVVGEMEVVKAVEPDPTQFDKKSKYYDPKPTKENPRWFGPTVSFRSRFKNRVGLEMIKEMPSFSGSRLLQKGNRLSVIELTKKQYDDLCKEGRKKI